MSKIKIVSSVLERLAEDRRIYVGDWRFHIICMRVARSANVALPETTRVVGWIKSLCRSHHMTPVLGLPGVFRITVPYASILPAPQEAAVQEANPTAVFSHFTAAVHHDLTDQIPKRIFLTEFGETPARLPLGTTPEDWVDVPEPRRRTPKQMEQSPIQWSQSKAEWDFGVLVGYAQGSPIYLTDLERTLLDSLRYPDDSGGILEVLRMWKRAVPRANLDLVVKYVERFNQRLLRQRVGFLFEKLNLAHPILQEWANKSIRGSSAKLVASREFSSTFSERWKLSLNVPETVLAELDGE